MNNPKNLKEEWRPWWFGVKESLWSGSPVNLDYFHKTIYRIFCKIRRVVSHVYASVRKDQQEQILEHLYYGKAFLFVDIGCFQCWRNMKSRKNLLIDFEICLSFWVACGIPWFIAWASGSMIVFGQLNYTKIRWFHAIFMPVIIGFLRCIGTYSSAKFELIIQLQYK